MSDQLTPRQREILDFIRSTLEVLGAPPTRAEICGAFGFASPTAAEDHLRALAKKGAIVLEPGSARGIRLVEQLGLPLIGSVAAGSPLLAVENQLGRVKLDGRMFNPPADYLLKVRGNSMADAGILDGDLLAVHRTPEARSGQIVVARLGDEVTVKRLRRRGRQARGRGSSAGAAAPRFPQPNAWAFGYQSRSATAAGRGP
jgi:repressor LexA